MLGYTYLPFSRLQKRDISFPPKKALLLLFPLFALNR
jgi:hypothetical protein